MSVRILKGDCLSVMPTLEADSIDAVISDPPYGLKFMGKQWDHGVPGVPFWEAAKRVAKPSAYLLAFGGTRTHHRLTCAIEDAGWEIRDCLMWLHGQGFPKGKAQLKPAWEPIIMARKKGTLQPLNIDECRISHTDDLSRYERSATSAMGYGGVDKPTLTPSHPSGRWPANLILDEESAEMLDEQSGDRAAGGFPQRVRRERPHGVPFGTNEEREQRINTDAGGASRFFYTAKASRSEREAGLEGFAAQRSGVLQDDTYKWERDGKGNPINLNTRARNHHPTVKPLDLMQWLCRLVTPKGGTILDPFMGSGTTGRAAIAEGFSFVGIELSPEYAQIARARIAEYAPLFGDVA